MSKKKKSIYIYSEFKPEFIDSERKNLWIAMFIYENALYIYIQILYSEHFSKIKKGRVLIFFEILLSEKTKQTKKQKIA